MDQTTISWTFQSIFFLSFGNQRAMSPIEKILILWFCWAQNIVFHCLIFVRFATSWRVSSMCSNSTMWLIKIWVGKKSRLGRELFVGNVYFLALKGKVHKPIETMCVRWLPWVVCGKHIEPCVHVHPNQCSFHSPT